MVQQEATIKSSNATVNKVEQPSNDSSCFKLVGFDNFIRTNPKSDLFSVKGFHHAEFWCADATNTANRFSWGLGVTIVAKSDLSTGNSVHTSYVLGSGEMRLLFTAPYSPSVSKYSCPATIPSFSIADHRAFTAPHGLAVRFSNRSSNLPELGPVVQYLRQFTGFHEFAEFTAEDVGTEESGLNSVALANNHENVLLVLAEPVHGTKRKSQTQNFLEHNEGPGVHHLALASKDIFKTLREMRKRSGVGGFEFMPPPLRTYFKNLKNRVRDVLSDDQMKECEELGILVDRDDRGTLLQIFTTPVGARPTILIEIIQRLGCMEKDENGKEYEKGGCGGLGKGNVAALIKSVEDYEKILQL